MHHYPRAMLGTTLLVVGAIVSVATLSRPYELACRRTAEALFTSALLREGDEIVLRLLASMPFMMAAAFGLMSLLTYRPRRSWSKNRAAFLVGCAWCLVPTFAICVLAVELWESSHLRCSLRSLISSLA